MTKPQVWPTDRPFVVFMVPAEGAEDYYTAMNRLSYGALQDMEWSFDSVDVLCLVSSSAQQGTEGLLFLEEIGVDTRSITLLMFWGETSKCVNFDDVIPEECGLGAIVLAETGVVVPAVRMPSLESGWWEDPLHREYATTVFGSLIRDGREVLDGSEPSVFVSRYYAWN